MLPLCVYKVKQFLATLKRENIEMVVVIVSLVRLFEAAPPPSVQFR